MRGWSAGAPGLDVDDTLLGAVRVRAARAGGVVGAAAKIVAIEPIPGRRELIDITTGTGDFVANGVISHNCYARPSHAYVDLSPGLDFETKLFYKADAARLLVQELAKPHYVCKPIMLGREHRSLPAGGEAPARHAQRARSAARTRHPAAIVTRGALLERHLDRLLPPSRADPPGARHHQPPACSMRALSASSSRARPRRRRGCAMRPALADAGCSAPRAGTCW